MLVITLKRSVKFIVIIIILFGCFYYKDDIIKFFVAPAKKTENKEIKIPESNEYKLSFGEYEYVQLTDNFVPDSKQDILNIVYTTLNSGWDSFTFYCPESYTTCVDDVTSITNNNETLSNINNYVHPYNSFKTIETNYSTSGEVTLNIHKLYSDTSIKLVNEKVDEIYNSLINDGMSERDKIKTIHDYIINNTEYDDEKIDGVTKLYSNSARGVLLDGYGICSGYTDAMAIFLNKMGIQNIKVSSQKHIWNLVFIEGKWQNLDLTFDDPTPSPDNGEDILIDDYFLIDTKTMQEIDTSGQHYFDEDIFKEALNN